MESIDGRGLYSAGMAELERLAAYLKDESMPMRGKTMADEGSVRAIGLRSDAVVGSDAASDQMVIETLARRHGYCLTGLYVAARQLPSHSVAAGVLEMVHVARAAAVIVPGLPHLGGSVPVEFTRVCSVIMPGHMMLGHSLYPTSRPPFGGEPGTGPRK